MHSRTFSRCDRIARTCGRWIVRLLQGLALAALALVVILFMLCFEFPTVMEFVRSRSKRMRRLHLR